MDIRQPFDQLLSKEVDRREFLAHVGAAGLGIIGVTSIIKALTGSQTKKSSSGYGGSSYGGGERKLGKIQRRLG